MGTVALLQNVTAYEQQQVREISGWKAEAPALVVEALGLATRPLVRLAKRFIPKQSVKDAITIAYKNAEILAHREEVAKRAGVSDIHELQKANLKLCDDLAEHFTRI